MHTKPLERFATQARRDLLATVDAQATAVLTLGSVARSERSETVNRLESEIAAHGREHVIDKVAYIWFNRIIALRFMDARGYTDAGVVSPARGQTHGQPEVLADAKRGNVDTDVVTNKRAIDAINGLLDGTRSSSDAEGEAYALLLTEYCRYWHKAMPFMFEREGDYTELLVPTGLLADGAILSRARDILTEDVCADVEVIGWLYQFYISERKDEVFAGFKKNKKAGAAEIPAATQLFTPHWIVRYLVENSLGRLWMLNRPSSALVDQMEYYIAPVDEEVDFLTVSAPEELTVIDPACGSGHMLTYAFDLLYAIYEEEGYAPSEIPQLIITHNLHGTEIDPRAGSLAAFALTMKARFKQRTFFDEKIEPNICVFEPVSFDQDELDALWPLKSGPGLTRVDADQFWNTFAHADVFGSLIRPDPDQTRKMRVQIEQVYSDDLIGAQALSKSYKVLDYADILTRKYAVGVANPPYMSSKNMGEQLAEFVKQTFPDGKQDLYGCFVLQTMSFVASSGYVAAITGDTWMSIISFEALRNHVLAGHSFDSFVHLRDISNHPDIFGANTAFVLAMTPSTGRQSPFIKLAPLNEEEKRRRLIEAISVPDCAWRFSASVDDFSKMPGSPIAYWLGVDLLRVLQESKRLESVSDARQGLSPADKPRFMRSWWEVSFSRTAMGAASVNKWYPYNKGGGFRKWFGNIEHVINWQHDGAEIRAYPNAVIRNSGYYFRESITWSKVSSGRPSFRRVPAASMFDGAAGALFPHHHDEILPLLGILNTTVIEDVLAAYAPTLNFTEGSIASLPIPEKIEHDSLRELVEGLVARAKSDWDSDETSWEFVRPDIWSGSDQQVSTRFFCARTAASERVQQIRASERKIDQLAAESFGLSNWRVSDSDDLSDVGLRANPFAPAGSSGTENLDMAVRLISYAVGCIFGRYSLEEPGLILADQGATIPDYVAKVSSTMFLPGENNVIPFIDDNWFEDDIVERFRQFLGAAFGAEHFEENLHFIEESLNVNSLRDYFITKAGKSKFFDDHVQRYKKRPIYWMFSSPKGSFNALIYMHRYNPSTVSTVLNEYLREYRSKLEVGLTNAERTAASGASAKDQKEADRLRKVLTELRDYEHDVLYPLATQQIAIDLDDGVKANYPKFYPALRKITGLETADE
jgi:hypothetical protein